MSSNHSFDVARAADSVYRLLDGRTLLGRWRLSFEPDCLVATDTTGSGLAAYVAWDPDGYSEMTGQANSEDSVVAKFYFEADGPESVCHEEYSVHLDPVDTIGSAIRLAIFMMEYLTGRTVYDMALLGELAP